MAAASIKTGTGQVLIDDLENAPPGFQNTGAGSIAIIDNASISGGGSGSSDDAGRLGCTVAQVNSALTWDIDAGTPTADYSADKTYFIFFCRPASLLGIQLLATIANDGIEAKLYTDGGRTNFRSYVCGGNDAVPPGLPRLEQYFAVVVNPRQTTTRDDIGGTFNDASVTEVEWRIIHLGTGSSALVYFSKTFKYTPMVLIGGDGASADGVWQDFLDHAATDEFRVFRQQGEKEFMVQVPIAIGDNGTNATEFDDTGISIEFAPLFDATTKKTVNIHAEINELGLVLDLGTSDSYTFRGWTFNSIDKYEMIVKGNTAGTCKFQEGCLLKGIGTFQMNAGAQIIDSQVSQCDELILN